MKHLLSSVSVFLIVLLILKAVDFSALGWLDYALFVLLGADAVLTVAVVVGRHRRES
jgi:hypothetical protein